MRERRVAFKLSDDDYHYEQSMFPAALSCMKGETLLIHGTGWNRLDITDPRNGTLLTDRVIHANGLVDGRYVRAEHDLDYFHGQLLVSPDGDGWQTTCIRKRTAPPPKHASITETIY